VLAVALALAGSAFAASTSFVLVGTWKGTLHQRGIDPFTAKATIRGLAKTARNTVHYTGINCSGRWTYLGKRKATYRFREKISTGRGGKCKGTGIVTVTPKSPNTLGYIFRGGGVVSRGVLVRVR
jgi:hypothetical protein